MIALSKIYSLDSPEVRQTIVKGELIIDPATSEIIMTRSRAKQREYDLIRCVEAQPNVLTPSTAGPDQYTMIPAPLKILKVLIEELLSASGLPAREGDPSAAAAAAATADFDDDDDDGWEDDNDILDLSLGTNKSALMGYLSGDGQLPRERDDETQTYLTEFFVRAAREDIAGFGGWYNMLSDFEKQKLNECANAAAPVGL